MFLVPNSSGELGDGTTTHRYTPVKVSSLSSVTVIAAGEDIGKGGAHSVAVRSSGSVFAWGNNDWGQLGDGCTWDRLTPVQVSTLSGVIGVAAAASHTLAIRSDGSVWAWGTNNYCQLGDGITAEQHLPLQVAGPEGVGHFNLS